MTTTNPFEAGNRMTSFAIDYLKYLDKTDIFLAWTKGFLLNIISPSVLITLAFSSIFKPPKVKQFEQIIGHARKGGEEIGLDQLDLFMDSPSVRNPSGASGSKLGVVAGQEALKLRTVFINSAVSIFISSASSSRVFASKGGTRVLTVAFQLWISSSFLSKTA